VLPLRAQRRNPREVRTRMGLSSSLRFSQ